MASAFSKLLGVKVYRSLDLDEGAAEVVKATPGTLFGIWVCNQADSTRYLKIYNRVSATAGTHTPVITIPIPGNSSDDVLAIMGIGGGKGVYFDTGICIAATTGIADADTGAPSANDVVINAFYL